MKKRKIFKKTIKGTKVMYRKKKPSKARCAECGKTLQGTLNLISSKIRNIAKTKKRPSRKYGGYLCFSCLKKKLMKEARRKNV